MCVCKRKLILPLCTWWKKIINNYTSGTKVTEASSGTKEGYIIYRMHTNSGDNEEFREYIRIDSVILLWKL